MDLFNKLAGYKTYITAFIMIATGINMMLGGDLTGGFQFIMQGLAAAGIRHGIGNNQPPIIRPDASAPVLDDVTGEIVK